MREREKEREKERVNQDRVDNRKINKSITTYQDEVLDDARHHRDDVRASDRAEDLSGARKDEIAHENRLQSEKIEDFIKNVKLSVSLHQPLTDIRSIKNQLKEVLNPQFNQPRLTTKYM